MSVTILHIRDIVINDKNDNHDHIRHLYNLYYMSGTIINYFSYVNTNFTTIYEVAIIIIFIYRQESFQEVKKHALSL